MPRLCSAFVCLLGTFTAFGADRECDVSIGPQGALARMNGADTALSGPGGSSAAIQTCIDSLAPAGGLILLAAGVYPLETTLQLPPGNDDWLRVNGQPGTVLRLSPGAPSAFRFGRTEDHQEFRKIELSGFAVDGANVGGREGGVILTSTNNDRRLRVADLRVSHIAATNVPTDADVARNHRGGITITVLHVLNNEPIADWIRRVDISDVTIDGGNWGVIITASGGSEPRHINVQLDQISISRSVHRQRVTGRGFPSTNFHIGSYGLVGQVTLRDLQGFNAGDNCIEVNNATALTATAVHCENPFNVGWTLVNYNSETDAATQSLKVSDSDVQITSDISKSAIGNGWGFAASHGSHAIGEVVLSKCRYRNDSIQPGVAVYASSGAARLSWRRIALVDFEVTQPHVTSASASTRFFFPLYLLRAPATAGADTPGTLVLQRVRVNLGVLRESGLIDIAAIALGGGNVRLDASELDLSFQLSGSSGGGWAAGIWFGAGLESAISGTVSNLTWTIRGDWGNRVWPIRVDDAKTLAASQGLSFAKLDLTAGAKGAPDFFWGASADNREHIRVTQSLWNSHPSFPTAKGQLQPKAVTFSSSPTVYTNTDLVPESVEIPRETTKLSWSTDRVTWTPRDASLGSVTLEPGESLMFEFSSTPVRAAITPSP